MLFDVESECPLVCVDRAVMCVECFYGGCFQRGRGEFKFNGVCGVTLQ